MVFRDSLIHQLVKNPPAMQKTPVQLLCEGICWRRDRLPIPVFLGYPCDSAGKESACNVGDLSLIPELEDPLDKGKATHSSILAWRIPCVVTKSQTRLSDFHFHSLVAIPPGLPGTFPEYI